MPCFWRHGAAQLLEVREGKELCVHRLSTDSAASARDVFAPSVVGCLDDVSDVWVPPHMSAACLSSQPPPWNGNVLFTAVFLMGSRDG